MKAKAKAVISLRYIPALQAANASFEAVSRIPPGFGVRATKGTGVAGINCT